MRDRRRNYRLRFYGKMHTLGYKTIPLYYTDLPFKIRLVGVCNRTRQKAEAAGDAGLCVLPDEADGNHQSSRY